MKDEEPETFEDLLRLQSEFLKNRDRPAARVIRTSHESYNFGENDEKEKNEKFTKKIIEEDDFFKDMKVVELSDQPLVPLEFKFDNVRGFPVASQRAISPERIAKHKTGSVEMESISQENAEKIKKMTADEIAEAQKEIRQLLSTSAMLKLKNKNISKNEEKNIYKNIVNINEEEIIELEYLGENIKISKKELKKLEWTEPGMPSENLAHRIEERKKNKEFDWLSPEAKNNLKFHNELYNITEWRKKIDATDVQLEDLRFDFNGLLCTSIKNETDKGETDKNETDKSETDKNETAKSETDKNESDISETDVDIDNLDDPLFYWRGLHHHGQDPDLPGYTLPELLYLAQSSSPSQRSLAISTLAAIFNQCRVICPAKNGGLAGFGFGLNRFMRYLLFKLQVPWKLRCCLNQRSLVSDAATLRAISSLLKPSTFLLVPKIYNKDIQELYNIAENDMIWYILSDLGVKLPCDGFEIKTWEDISDSPGALMLTDVVGGLACSGIVDKVLDVIDMFTENGYRGVEGVVTDGLRIITAVFERVQIWPKKRLKKLLLSLAKSFLQDELADGLDSNELSTVGAAYTLLIELLSICSKIFEFENIDDDWLIIITVTKNIIINISDIINTNVSSVISETVISETVISETVSLLKYISCAESFKVWISICNYIYKSNICLCNNIYNYLDISHIFSILLGGLCKWISFLNIKNRMIESIIILPIFCKFIKISLLISFKSVTAETVNFGYLSCICNLTKKLLISSKNIKNLLIICEIQKILIILASIKSNIYVLNNIGIKELLDICNIDIYFDIYIDIYNNINIDNI
eukprot:GHVL01038942.1.p1 GENE.GHVL01038942.1~~GHVL01038942.1.p1  ORF type:complete len:814 (+),score=284.09 GHVL01038942.1:1224-3665(+)